jgi:lysozyme family protein
MIMSNIVTYDNTKADYTSLLMREHVRPEWQGAFDRAANYIIKNRARYEAVAKDLNIPWALIGCLHWREADGSFAGVLHNGDKIIGTGRKTYHVPAGRGPFDSWEDAAVDAINIKLKTRPPAWDLLGVAWFAENFNGLGYRKYYPDVKSPYLWSGSTVYDRGKYTSDGHFDRSHRDQQIGVMPLYQIILDKTQPAAQAAARVSILGRAKQTIQWLGASLGSLFTLDSLGTLQTIHGQIEGMFTAKYALMALIAGIFIYAGIKVIEAYQEIDDVGPTELPTTP